MNKSNPKNKAKQPWWESLGIQIFVIAFSSFLLYYNTFSNGFVLDDLSAVQQNEQVQKGVSAIPEILTTPYHYGYDHKDGGLYRPMSVVVLAIEKSMFGTQPKAFHVMQTLLYMLCSLLVLMASRKILGKAAGFVALFFVFSTVHTEVVANIKSLDEILGAIGFASALYFFQIFLESSKKLSLVFSLLSYLFALFSKESTVALLPVFPLLAYIYHNANVKDAIKRSYTFLFPALVFIICFLTFTNSNEAQGNIEPIENAAVAAQSGLETILFKLQLLYQYIVQSVININPNHDYAYRHFNYYDIGDLAAWWHLIIVVAVFSLAILSFKKNKVLFLGFAIWILPLLTTSNILFNIRWTFGERFMFLPVWGMGIIVYELFYILSTQYIKNLKTIPVFIIIYIIASSYTVVHRNKDWKSNLTLFEADVKKSPNNVRIHAMLGKEYHDRAIETRDRNLLQQSTDEYYKSISIQPISEFLNGLGVNYMDIRQYDSAMKYFNWALKLKPSSFDTWHNLGNAQYNIKQFEAATKSYMKALDINPNYFNSVVNLANMYMEQGYYRDAINYGIRASKLNPDDKNVLRNLSIYYQKNNQPDSAMYYQKLAQ